MLVAIRALFMRPNPMFRSQRSGGALLSRRAELAARIKKARADHKARKALCGEAKRLTTSILAGRG